jgi:hypothetical protein
VDGPPVLYQLIEEWGLKFNTKKEVTNNAANT